ncbi:hypothetical protein JCM5353_002453 [Sporobolomyces roseus]
MMLPTEILDIVFSQVHLKTAAPTSESQATFSSLCLTSKHFLPLAREYLYYRPIRVELDKARWTQALALENTLSNIQLSRLVHSLEGLVRWSKMSSFKDHHAVSSGSLHHTPTSPAGFDYIVRVLGGCNQLIEVDVFFKSSEDLALVAQALQKSRSSLRTVRFLGKTSPMSGPPITDDLVHEALRLSPFEQIDKLELDDIHTPHRNASSAPAILLRLKSLRIWQVENLNCIPQFFLANPTSLTTFAIRLPDPNDARLREGGAWPPHRPTRSEYIYKLGPELPLDLVSRFTSLRSLSLNEFRGPSLAFLDLLSISSPSLISMDFTYSFWITNDILDVSSHTSFAHSIFPETDILRILQAFNALRYIHFGYLPHHDREHYETFTSDLNARGVEMEWIECAEPSFWRS